MKNSLLFMKYLFISPVEEVRNVFHYFSLPKSWIIIIGLLYIIQYFFLDNKYNSPLFVTFFFVLLWAEYKKGYWRYWNRVRKEKKFDIKKSNQKIWTKHPKS